MVNYILLDPQGRRGVNVKKEHVQVFLWECHMFDGCEKYHIAFYHPMTSPACSVKIRVSYDPQYISFEDVYLIFLELVETMISAGCGPVPSMNERGAVVPETARNTMTALVNNYSNTEQPRFGLVAHKTSHLVLSNGLGLVSAQNSCFLHKLEIVISSSDPPQRKII